MKIHLFILAACTIASAATVDCRRGWYDVAFPVAATSGDNFFKIQDVEHPDFHFSALLGGDGVLTIAKLTAYDKGARSGIDIKSAVDRALRHFGNRVKAVEVTLSEKTGDETWGEISRDPELGKFNAEWNKANKTNDIQEAKQSGKPPADIDNALAWRAVYETPFGKLGDMPHGFTQVQIVDSMGQPGKFVQIRLRFERPQRRD